MNAHIKKAYVFIFDVIENLINKLEKAVFTYISKIFFVKLFKSIKLGGERENNISINKLNLDQRFKKKRAQGEITSDLCKRRRNL